ncbi:hypothetical protein ACU8KH_01797 [Lachancea thermotolerans]
MKWTSYFKVLVYEAISSTITRTYLHGARGFPATRPAATHREGQMHLNCVYKLVSLPPRPCSVQADTSPIPQSP